MWRWILLTLFDFGSYGSNKDCGLLLNSLMGEGLEKNVLNIPEDEPLHGCKFTPFPYFKKWLIKPYPGRNLCEEQKIYKYCLSRACWTCHRKCLWHFSSYMEDLSLTNTTYYWTHWAIHVSSSSSIQLPSSDK